MPDENEHQPWHRYRDVMTASAKLAQTDGEKALKQIDDAIEVAIQEGDNRWIMMLRNHAAIIAEYLGKTELVKRYHQQSLGLNAENPTALYGLAKLAKNAGDLLIAEDYATRCRKALKVSDDFLKDARLQTLEELMKDRP
jgi:Tfp pilus assembly protein PilF